MQCKDLGIRKLEYIENYQLLPNKNALLSHYKDITKFSCSVLFLHRRVVCNEKQQKRI